MCYMRNALIDKIIQRPLMFGVFADNIKLVCKYAKYEALGCQKDSHAHTVMTFISSTSYCGADSKFKWNFRTLR